jgi:hypothetical protein
MDVTTLAAQLHDPDVLGRRGWERTKEHQALLGKVFLYSHFLIRIAGKSQDLILIPAMNRNQFKVRPREFSGEEWLYWDQSDYASLDPKTVLRDLGPQIELIRFNISKSYTLPADFLPASKEFKSLEELARYLVTPLPPAASPVPKAAGSTQEAGG